MEVFDTGISIPLPGHPEDASGTSIDEMIGDRVMSWASDKLETDVSP